MNSGEPIEIAHCDESRSDAILAILNDAIERTTAIYDYRPWPPEAMAAWFAAKRAGNYPVLGALGGGTLLGFATYGPFRNRPAYKYTVEHSVYVAAEHRGRGIGAELLRRLIEEARRQDYHLLVGAIDSQNAASIRLHRGLGFEHSGTIRQAGFKFDHWLDLDFYQLILDTPRQPVDDAR